MADITAKARIRGERQANDRPISWHVWDISWNDADAASGDTILLPDVFSRSTFVLDARGQVVAVSGGSVSNSVAFTMGARVILTGVYTAVDTPWTGLSTITTPGANIFTASGTSVFSSWFNSAGIIAGTSEARCGITITKGGTAGTLTPRVLVSLALGRIDY